MAKKTKTKAKMAKLTCGVIMPISSIDGCSESHWADVLEIISESIEDAGFEHNLVSNADDIGVIQKRIIQNLYDNPVVVCDVSGKNPNVMFELGLRLAFDKPTIIIKDDKTTYSFDTSPIEHLEYPRDLRFNKMIDFREKLSDKIKGTYDKFKSDTNYSTFLKHFGEFKVAKIEQKEVPEQEYIIEELNSLKNLILESNNKFYPSKFNYRERGTLDVCLRNTTSSMTKEIFDLILDVKGIKSTQTRPMGPKHNHIYINPEPDVDISELRLKIQKLIGNKYPVRIR